MAVALACTAREGQRSRNSLSDDAHRFVARQLTETTHERLFTQAIDGIDRVARIACRRRELFRDLPRARVYDGVADRGMHCKNRFEQPLCAGSVTSHCRPFAAASSRRPSPPFV